MAGWLGGLPAAWRWVVVFALCIAAIVGCSDRQGAGSGAVRAAVEGDLHTINIQVHPGNARVTVRTDGGDSMAVVEQQGPRATFKLPSGSYRYEVHASGYQRFEGLFEIPRNRNLEVWLSSD